MAAAAEPAPVVEETILPVVKVRAKRDPSDAPPPNGLRAENQESATKMGLSLRETPQAVTVITSDSIELRQARDVTSALELTAGLVPSDGSTIGGPFAGRGLEPGEGFALRGQTLNPSRDIKVDGFSLAASQFDLAPFERIEVAKGPAVLYGQGSLGGFINFVRKKPQAVFGAQLAITAGSWDTYRAEADITAALDEDADVTGRLIAVYDDSGSFIDGVWGKRALLAPSLEWRIGGNTKLLLSLIHQDDRFVPSHGIPLFVDGDKLRAPNVRRSLFVGAPAQDDSLTVDTVFDARLDHRLSDNWLATLVLEKGRQKFERYFDSYGHGGLGPLPNAGPDPADRPLRNNVGDTWLYADTMRTRDDTWAGDLRLEGRYSAFGREHRVLLGADRNQRKFSGAFGYQFVGIGNIYSEVFTTDGTRARDLPVDEWTGYIRNTGVYAQTQLSLADRTKLLVGLRHDSAQQGSSDQQETKRATTARVGLTHDLSKAVTAYASWGQSFNPVEDRAYDGTDDGALMDPERGTGYEVGLKTDWFDKKLSATLALYRSDLKNTPIPDPAHEEFSIASGKRRTQGVELEVFGSPARGWQIGGGVSIGKSRFINPDDPEYGLVPYGYIGRNAGIYGSYEWQEGLLRGFGMGLTYSYVGKRSFAYADLAKSGYVSGATSDQLWFEGYDRTDLNLYYNAIPNWRLSLQVRNLFDQIYIEHMRDVESNNYFGSPRALLLRAEYRFH